MITLQGENLHYCFLGNKQEIVYTFLDDLFCGYFVIFLR